MLLMMILYACDFSAPLKINKTKIIAFKYHSFESRYYFYFNMYSPSLIKDASNILVYYYYRLLRI